MGDREAAIRKLGVGDIFHGRSQHGTSLTCLVTALDGDTIQARRITTQDALQFDRETGRQLGRGGGTIDCVTPFPPEIHSAFSELDRKYQAFGEMRRRGVEPDPEQYKLTPAEVRALLSIDDHTSSHPISRSVLE
jgi:hypothetical protein